MHPVKQGADGAAVPDHDGLKYSKELLPVLAYDNATLVYIVLILFFLVILVERYRADVLWFAAMRSGVF